MPIRIGLNCANVLVGNVGSSERLSYTVMGDGVNVAARLEGINKVFGSTICISDSVFDAVEANILARPLRKVQVKGRKHTFMIYELLGIKGTSDPELVVRDRDARLSEMTWEARALSSWATMPKRGVAMDIFTDDPVAKSMLDAVENASAEI